MTTVKTSLESDAPRSGSEWAVAVLGPVIALGTVTAALALAAALLGFHREEMLFVAAGIGSILGIPTIVLLYRQRADRRGAQRALLNVEARMGGIVESAMDAIITVDESQRIVQFNAAAERVFRWARKEALGAPLAELIPQRFRASHEQQVRQFGAAGEASRRMGSARVVMGLRRDGEEFPIEASISQVTEHGQRFYTVILRDITERTRNERALRESREELREFAVAANSVRELEKSRFARELHDELGQALTALKIDVGWLRERTPAASESAQKLAAMQGLIDATVAAARRISADLRPLMLDDLGLTAACDWLATSFTSRTGIACELVIAGGDLDLPDPHATALFRVLQESLTNVARHSGARQVEVSLERDDETVTLAVRDDGQGFAPGDPRKPNSYGLLGVRERAYLLGGDVKVESAPGQGTSIELRLPAPQALSAS